MKVLTATQMREVDRLTTERHGVPSLKLMENAGTRVVEFLVERFADLAGRRIVVLCGKGNNGGDGFVVARLLKERGCNPSVFLFATPDAVRGDAAVNLERWEEGSGGIHTVTSAAEWEAIKDVVGKADILLDALLGTGLGGPVEGLLATVIEDVTTLHAPARPAGGRAVVVAVDIPSGLSSDTGRLDGPAIWADYTVTFTAPKLGQLLPPGSDHVGKLVVRSIGSPPELYGADPALKVHMLEPNEFRDLPAVAARRANTHKGDYGHCLIVSGSRGKTGAAGLAAWGALRIGVGLATVATPDAVLPIVASYLPELMTEPLLSTEVGSISVRNLDYGHFSALLQGKNVLAMGPGLSTYDETQQFVRAVVADCPLPIILDADALNAFVGRAEEFNKRRSPTLAVTPHPGEMARLLGCTTKEVQADRLGSALKAAARWNAHVILKGFHTIVATPDGRSFINSTGNPGMATAGTGDVLTGMLAGLTAQFGVEHWERVLGLGVYLHGLAGDLAAAEVGEAPLMAMDLVREIPRAFKQLLAAQAASRTPFRDERERG